jgi:uncharacterized SAM-binding protein YcdF (DUF218 family)
MYFILSKVLLYLLFPVTWIFILFVISLKTKNIRRKRTMLITAIALFYVFSNSFLFNQFAKRWDIPAYYINKATPYSCAIVLGGFSGTDKDGNGFFNSSADRFIQGVKLLKTGKVSHILITGGNGNLNPGGFREGTWAKTQLQELKFPDSTILIESNSRNTIENARFSNIILKQAHLASPYILVTSAFHMRRSMMIFKKEGIKVIPYSCNFMTNRDQDSFDDYFIPSSDNLSKWNIYLKELVGYAVNYFNG